MIEIVRKVVRAHEHGSFMNCGMDTLLRIDEAPEILSCKHCIFQEIIIDDDVVCLIRVIGEFFLTRKGII